MGMGAIVAEVSLSVADGFDRKARQYQSFLSSGRQYLATMTCTR